MMEQWMGAVDGGSGMKERNVAYVGGAVYLHCLESQIPFIIIVLIIIILKVLG